MSQFSTHFTVQANDELTTFTINEKGLEKGNIIVDVPALLAARNYGDDARVVRVRMWQTSGQTAKMNGGE